MPESKQERIQRRRTKERLRGECPRDQKDSKI